MKQARSRTAQRWEAKIEARKAIGVSPAPVWVEAEVEPIGYYSHVAPDADNFIAALKGSIDGFVDAGLLLDDARLRWIMPRFRKVPTRAGRRVDLIVRAVHKSIRETPCSEVSH